jgi:hypothetical protein
MPARADGYGSEATGGSSSVPAASETSARPIACAPRLHAILELGLLFRSASWTGLAIAVAATLQQKNLAALRALPGKHPEFGIDALLQKPVSGNPG